MADDILAHCDAQAQRVDTLSMYNSAQRSCDERPYFLRVEEQRCRAGHHFDLSKYETTLHLEPLNLMSVPSFHGEADLQRSVQQLRRNRGYRVVLSGIGGDEFLGGVPDPRAQLADLLVQLRLSQFAGELKAWSLAKRRPLIQLLGQTLLVLMPRLLRTRIGQERRLANWIDGEFARSTQLGLRQLGPLGRFGFWLPSRRECARTVELMRFQMNYIHSASVALEERRFPYLDRNLIEFLFSIPANQISRPGERRSLMRRSLGGIVPAEVLERKTKAFGTYRSMKFIEERYEEICSLFDSPASEKCGYIDHVRFCQALLDAKNGDAPQLLRIIRVIFLEVWLNNLERHGIFKAVPRRSLRKNLAPVEAEGWSG